VRLVTLSVIATGILLLALMSRPEAAAACEGESISFEDAIRKADGAIYAGRITRADYRAGGYDITVDVQSVVRGPAAERIRRAYPGSYCDGIGTGQWGYVVRKVPDLYDPTRRHDLFFRIGRYYGRSALASAGLPDTATALDTRPTAASRSLGWLAVLAGAASFLVAYRRSRTDSPAG
jgi:hypothetical protein